MIATAIMCPAAGYAVAVATPVVCIVHESPVDGLDPASLAAALVIERRKSLAELETVEESPAGSCPARRPGRLVLRLRIQSPATVGLDDGTGAERFDLASFDPLDRAGHVAHLVVAHLPPPAGTGRASLVAGATVPPAAAAVPRTDVARTQGFVAAGGWYGYQTGPGLHAAGPDFEAGVAWLDEQLALGLRVGWQPPQEITPGVPSTRIQAVPVVATIRGGVRLSWVVLRAGLCAGVEWRRIEVSPPYRLDDVSATSRAGILGGEIEAVFRIGPVFRIAVSGTVKGYLGGRSYDWDASRLFEAPGRMFGAAVRLGAVFPGKADGGTR